MADYTQAAMGGAVLGIIASFFVGKKNGGFEKAATYAAAGVGAAVVGKAVFGSKVPRVVAGYYVGDDIVVPSEKVIVKPTWSTPHAPPCDLTNEFGGPDGKCYPLMPKTHTGWFPSQHHQDQGFGGHHDQHDPRFDHQDRFGHRTGWNLFGDVFGWTDPFSGQHAPGHRGHDEGHHDEHE